MSTIFCPHCGQQHRAGARFCPSTGNLLQVDPQPAPPISAAPQPPAAQPAASQEELYPSGGLTGRLPTNTFLHNRYIVLRKIGQGGMAAVYQATDTQSSGGNLWAIKEMSDAALSDPGERQYAIQSFQREAELLRRLEHPNLPKVIDAFTEGGKHYLVMEFVPGKTLNEMLEERGAPFTQAEVTPWAMQLCNVLSYLHNQNPKIIFRDLKPSNIMLTPQNQIKLIDFGIVRFFKPGQRKDTMALGTPGYSPPEAIEGQTDERSDIYSLCVVLHQLLTSNHPATTIFNLPPTRQFNPSVTTEMDKLLMQGLNNNRQQRWSSVDEMKTELARISQPHLAETHHAAAPLAAAQSAAESPPVFAPVSNAAASSHQSVYPEAAPAAPTDRSAARPTMRLVMAATRLSGRQIGLLVGALVVGLVLVVWLLSPLMDRFNFDWNNVLFVAIFGALGYSAFPRRGIAFASHTILTLLLVATVWARLGDQGYGILRLLLGALISGVFMEVWVVFLPRLKAGSDKRGWLWEMGWLAMMAVAGAGIFIGITTSWIVTGFKPLQIFFSALLGALGWFLGDLFNQYQFLRREGLYGGRDR
ncbi:protein kinase [Chloroflexota bacterium]